MKEKIIGFVGLGRMGSNMARRLRDQGYRIGSVYDIDSSVASAVAAELGTVPAPTHASVTAACDIIFTVVTDDAAMESLFFGPQNLFEESAGRLFINCATLTPEIHRRLGEAAEIAGAKCLEACMASSIPQARNGELLLMVGGDEDVFQSSLPLLNDLSTNLHFVGAAGKASEVKALVNMVMNINTAGLAEGLGIGKALGIDLDMLCKIFSQTGANSRVLETDANDMIHRDHECYFSAEHAAKDSGIALQLAETSGVEAPLARATLLQYQKLTARGLGGLDKSGIAELTFPDRG